MIKKLICVLLAAAMTLSLASAAIADEDQSDDDWVYVDDYNPDEMMDIELPEVGLVMRLPENIWDITGVVDVMFSEEVGYGSGVYCTQFGYIAMSQDDYGNVPFDESYYLPLITFICLRNGCDMSSLSDSGIRVNWDDAYMMAVTGDYTHYAVIGTDDETLPDSFQQPFIDEYLNLLVTMSDVAYFSQYSEPENPFAQQDGTKVVFETTDLYGNPVSSSDLFSRNEITMVNFWATWCGWCVGELPELEKINGRLQQMGCGVIGVLTDGEDPEDLQDAKNDVNEAGVTYPVVLVPENAEEYFDFGRGMPVTYFINRDGEIVGTPVVGAQVDKYEQAVADILSGKAA